MARILFVYTSASKNLIGEPTGWYLPEAAHPYYILAPHFEIDFASPEGPNPPVAPGSVEAYKSDEESVKFIGQDEEVKQKFATAKRLTEVNPADYVALFYPGGHGPVIDLWQDENNIKLANEFYRAGKVVSAVCHGPAALVGVTGADGKSIFAGRTATGFSNVEEELAKAVNTIPWLLEDKIVSLSGNYVKAPNPWESKVVTDGNVITGQNPASGRAIGEEILKVLKA